MNYRTSLVLLLFLVATSSVATTSSIYEEEMLRLNHQEHIIVENLSSYQGKPLITSFFIPDCRWCKRQQKVLKKIQSECPALSTVLLGVQGSKKKLKHELKRFKISFPAYLANNNIVKAIGKDTPVPLMLVFNEAGKLAFKTIGFTAEKKLVALLKQYNVLDCLIL